MKIKKDHLEALVKFYAFVTKVIKYVQECLAKFWKKILSLEYEHNKCIEDCTPLEIVDSANWKFVMNVFNYCLNWHTCVTSIKKELQEALTLTTTPKFHLATS